MQVHFKMLQLFRVGPPWSYANIRLADGYSYWYPEFLPTGSTIFPLSSARVVILFFYCIFKHEWFWTGNWFDRILPCCMIFVCYMYCLALQSANGEYIGGCFEPISGPHSRSVFLCFNLDGGWLAYSPENNRAISQ